jgi:inhibitor of KinA
MISEDLNRKALALADHFDSYPFDGFIEAVPAYASTTIFYDPTAVRNSEKQGSASEAVAEIVRAANVSEKIRPIPAPPIVELNAVFEGPDLSLVAAFAGMATAQVIDIFLSRTYRVYMLGFLPGFTYMAEVDARIAMPRKETPRTDVPKGSIGIAGQQAGIYSLPSPGGWQLIGTTDAIIFAPDADPPTLLQPGDSVKFIAR